MKTVSNNTKAKLVKNIKSYTATMFEMFNSNKTVPLDKAGKSFEIIMFNG